MRSTYAHALSSIKIPTCLHNYRLLKVKEIVKTGQIQLPVWSPDGRMVAFSVLKAGRGQGTPIESARILVFREGGSIAVSARILFRKYVFLDFFFSFLENLFFLSCFLQFWIGRERASVFLKSWRERRGFVRH